MSTCTDIDACFQEISAYFSHEKTGFPLIVNTENAERYNAMHALRDDPSYRAVVDDAVEVPEKADTRDTEAILRIATAYLKLLFPHVQRKENMKNRDFKAYCLKPAMEMRSIIKIQLGILDPDEFGGKTVPNITVKDWD